MKDKLSIKIKIANRYYPLNIDPNEEERIRASAKMVEQRIDHYREKYHGKDVQDCLAMAALQLAIKSYENERQLENMNFIEDIKELTDELDEYLEKNE